MHGKRTGILILLVLLTLVAVAGGYWRHERHQSRAVSIAAGVSMPMPPTRGPATPPDRPDRLFHGDTSHKLVALTFDDGPRPETTARLLAILERHQVKATFFVVGEMVARHPELLQAIARQGHAIGNHSYDHPNLATLSEAEVLAEWQQTNDLVQRVTGETPRLCRPPSGRYSPQTLDTIHALGMEMVLWSVDPSDYLRPGAQTIRTRVLGHVHNGDIILLHDGVTQTADMLGSLIDTLQARGYQLVTVEELAAANAPTG